MSVEWVGSSAKGQPPVNPDGKRNRDCINQSLGFQQENVINPPAHKVFERWFRFTGYRAAKQQDSDLAPDSRRAPSGAYGLQRAAHRPHHIGGRTGLPFQRVHSITGPGDLNFLFSFALRAFIAGKIEQND